MHERKYGDKYISQMCVRYSRPLLQFYSCHYTVPDRVAMPSEFSKNFVYERQHLNAGPPLSRVSDSVSVCMLSQRKRISVYVFAPILISYGGYVR